ncbi:MAG: site-2 protease family protein [Candidatus Micrarchaeaceae archaeon]
MATAKKVDWTRIYAVVAIALAFIVLLYYSPIGVVSKWFLGIAGMFFFGAVLQKMGSFSGGFGLYMVGGRRGIKSIDKISKKGGSFWENMALFGLVLGFGIFSYFFVRNNKRLFVFGLAALLLMMLFVLPYLSYGVQFLNLPQISAETSTTPSGVSATGPSLFSYITYAVTMVTGFSGFTFLLIWYNAGLILSATYTVLTSALQGHAQIAPLANQIPGVAPVIPGIDIPLVAGIISLALLLITHEFSHGILARKAKVRLKSIGFLLFGVIPIGAFVEPDEKEVSKLGKIPQTKIFAAGIASNFVATLVFFALMVPMVLFVIPNLYHTSVLVEGTYAGYPANGILKPGMQIQDWNGYQIKNLSSFSVAAANDRPGSIVRVVTNEGAYNFTAIASSSNATRGLIGVEVYQKSVPINDNASTRAALFIYSIIALSFMLNFLVAVVNLLPIPGFDGWRIYKTNFKHDYAIKALVWLLIIGLLLNALPWIPILAR